MSPSKDKSYEKVVDGCLISEWCFERERSAKLTIEEDYWYLEPKVNDQPNVNQRSTDYEKLTELL